MKWLLLLLVLAGGIVHAQPLKSKSVKIETGLSKMPTEQELTAMVKKVIMRKEHATLVSQIKQNSPSNLPFDQAYKWDLVRTRGWTTNAPYIRAYLMSGNKIAAVFAMPVKVERKKLVLDVDKQFHACVSVDCPICILQFDTDSMLLGCTTYGLDEAYYKVHPKAKCSHYLRKPYGEVLDPSLTPQKMRQLSRKKRRRK